LRRFITFEGIEGSGKTTQIQMLSNHLEETGVEHVLTRDQIRRLVLHPGNATMTATCGLLLYTAARAQHIEKVIGPSLAEGRMVLCDRFKDATLAYQGYGRGLSLELIHRLHALEGLALLPDLTLPLLPDLTLLFDIDVATALDRARHRDATKKIDETRFEQEDFAFHDKVRTGYLDLAQRESRRFVVIDAHGTTAEVHRRVLDTMQRVL
jgi:dTMP kinase